jgi:hypothetical protein
MGSTSPAVVAPDRLFPKRGDRIERGQLSPKRFCRGSPDNPSAVVVALLKTLRALKDENRILRGVASPGLACRLPLVCAPSS